MVHRLSREASSAILFTFDDGPHKKITPLVLELLEKYQVQAIFFIIGRFAYQNPDLLKMIIKKGHLIGNHTYTHPNNRIPDFFFFRKDIIRCQMLVKDILGIEPIFFRPPRGVINLKPLLAAKSLSLTSILWSNEGGEWGRAKSDDYRIIAEKLLETLKPRDIVLLHDNNPKVLKILDIVLPILKSRKADLSNGLRYLR